MATQGPIEEFTEFALEVEVGCIGELAARDNDDVEVRIRLQVAEQFACKALGSVSDDRSTNLAGCRNTETGMVTIIGYDEERHEPAIEPGSGLVGALEIRTTSNVFCRPESRHDALSRRHKGTACRPSSYRSSDTVNRFRPFARRRFRTC